MKTLAMAVSSPATTEHRYFFKQTPVTDRRFRLEHPDFICVTLLHGVSHADGGFPTASSN
jgi:hypothetical protein